jgi:hypothetical protein
MLFLIQGDIYNTNSRLGVGEELWVLDKVAEEVLLDKLCCPSSTMTCRNGDSHKQSAMAAAEETSLNPECFLTVC